MEIYSLHSIDLFLQGTFLLLCLILGLVIIFKDNLQSYKKEKTVANLSEYIHEFFKNLLSLINIGAKDQKIKSYKYLGLIPIFIISAFIIGILGKGIADVWIDSKSKNHLYLKTTWGKSVLMKDSEKLKLVDLEKEGESFKDIVRKKSFKKVFDKSPEKFDKLIVQQIYYQSKHEILLQENYANYVRKSQSIAEYSRIFSLGFFFLMACGFLNLVIMIFRVIFYKKDEEETLVKEGENKEESIEDYKIFSVPNGVILIFLGFSIVSIEVFINPYFKSYDLMSWEHFVVFLFTYFGLLIFLFFPFKRFRELKFSFFIYSIIYLVSYSGYFLSSRIWLESENQVSRKTYGLYKSNHITDSIKEIKYVRDSLKLDVDSLKK